MKKRGLSFLLVLCMMLLLCGAACGKKEEEKEICKVEDCDEEVYKKGYCEDHYKDYKDGKFDTDKQTSGNEEGNKGGTTNSTDNTDTGNNNIPVDAQAQGTYLSSMLSGVSGKLDEVQASVDAGSGMTMTADVKVSGALLEMVNMYLSQITNKNLDKLVAGLSLDMDTKGEEFGLAGKFTLNGESLEAKVLLQNGNVYIGIPALSDKYLMVDVTEFIGEGELPELPDMDSVDMEAIQKCVEDLVADITAAVTPSREEANAVISVKNAALGIDTSVSGTMFVDTLDSKKFMAAIKKCAVNAMKAVGMPDDQIREMEEELADGMDDSGNMILSLIQEENGGFALKLEMEGEDGIVKLVNNDKYALFAVQETADDQDQLFVYAEKTGKKKGNIYFVEDDQVLDLLSLSYEILNDGFKLSAKVDAGEAGAVEAELVLTQGNVELSAKFVSGGQTWVDAKLAMKQRAYKNPGVGVIDAMTDPDEWLATLSMDKLSEFLSKTLGLSLEDLMGGSDDDWNDDDWGTDWDDDWDSDISA